MNATVLHLCISCLAKHVTWGQLGTNLLRKKPTLALSWASCCELKLPQSQNSFRLKKENDSIDSIVSFYYTAIKFKTSKRILCCVKCGVPFNTGTSIPVKFRVSFKTGHSVPEKSGVSFNASPSIPVKCGVSFNTDPSVSVKCGVSFKTGPSIPVKCGCHLIQVLLYL